MAWIRAHQGGRLTTPDPSNLSFFEEQRNPPKSNQNAWKDGCFQAFFVPLKGFTSVASRGEESEKHRVENTVWNPWTFSKVRANFCLLLGNEESAQKFSCKMFFWEPLESWTDAPSGQGCPRRKLNFLHSGRWGESFWARTSARISAWTSAGYPTQKCFVYRDTTSQQPNRDCAETSLQMKFSISWEADFYHYWCWRAAGAVPVKTSTGSNFLENTREFPEIITSTGANFWLRFGLSVLVLVIFKSPILGACAMTTKFLDNKIFAFKIILSWRFPRKIAFWTIFLSAPLPTPPWKTQILFLLSSRFLWDLGWTFIGSIFLLWWRDISGIPVAQGPASPKNLLRRFYKVTSRGKN